jgi:hypothetical protein
MTERDKIILELESINEILNIQDLSQQDKTIANKRKNDLTEIINTLDIIINNFIIEYKWKKTYFTKEFLDEKIKDYTDYNGIVLNRIDEINEILKNTPQIGKGKKYIIRYKNI